jgi:hypothetical protein
VTHPADRLLNALMRRLLTVITVLSFSVLAPAPAANAEGTVLPLPTVEQVRADYAHGRFFVSGGKTSSAIVVVDEHGTIVKTIGGELGATGMALGAGQMYVARCGQATIDVIDTTTLVKSDTFAAPHLSGSCQIALAGGRLWYGSNEQHGQLASVGIAAPHTETLSTESLYGGGMFAASPAAPNLLVAAPSGSSPPTFTVYDVSGPAPVVVVSKRIEDSSDPRDMVLSPDAGTLYVSSGAPYVGRAYAVADLSVRHSYPTDAYPKAIAVSPDGASVAVGRTGVAAEIHIFHADGSSEIASTTYPQNGNPDLLARSLAFTADGKRVLAVVDENFGQQLVLHVFNPYTLAPPPMRLKASKSLVEAGKGVVVTASLGAWAAGRTFRLYGVPLGGDKTLVATVRVGATGRLTATVRPRARTTYIAEFAGDAVYKAAQSTAIAVRVRGVLKIRVTGSYRSTGGARLFHYSTWCWTKHVLCPSFGATLSPAMTGEMVKFTIQERRGKSWRTLSGARFATDATGRSGAIWKYVGKSWIGRTLRVRVTYSGSTALAPATARTATFKITR